MKFSDKISIDSIDYAIQGNAILGIRKSGKSYTATWIAERLMDDGIPFIAFDPIGIWRNLKIGKSGPGYPVVVAGDDGDLPLTPQSAPDIVRAAMKENVSLVVDLYSMKLSKKDWRTIVEQSIRLLLYENKPCGLRHIFIEEAAEFCPQRIQPEDGRVYAEIEKLARMGGNASLGYTLINQRPEEIHKAVLELCECIILHRQKGRHSLTALGKWLEKADTTNAEMVINSLPSLPKGTCWIWSEGSHSPEMVAISEKKTFHPDRENPLLASAGIASDVSTFVERMNKSLTQSAPAATSGKKPLRAIDQSDIVEHLARLQEGIATRDGVIRDLNLELRRCKSLLGDIQCLCLQGMEGPAAIASKPIDPLSTNGTGAKAYSPPEGPRRVRVSRPTLNGASLSKCARAILSFLAPYDREFTKVQVGICIGYAPGTGHFNNAIGELAARDFIVRGKGLRANKLAMSAIVSAIGQVKKAKYDISTFKSKLAKCERELYEILLDHPKKEFTKEQLAALTPSHYAAGTGHFNNSIGKLYSLDLIVKENGSISLHPDLAKML